MNEDDPNRVWGAVAATAAALFMASSFWWASLQLPYVRRFGRLAVMKTVFMGHLLGLICVCVLFLLLIGMMGFPDLVAFLKTDEGIRYLCAIGGGYLILSALCGMWRTLRLDHRARTNECK